MPRSSGYAGSYAATAAAAKRYDEITSAVENELELEQKLEELIAKERDNLNTLTESLRVKASPFDATVRLLQDQLASEAQQQTAAAAAARLPAELDPASYSNQTDFANKVKAFAQGSGKLSRAQLELLRAAADGLSPDQSTVVRGAISRIEGDKTRITSGAVAPKKPAPGQPSREQMVEQLAQMGETGWVGGAEGRAFREGLGPEQSRALAEYIRFLERGAVPPDDHPGEAVYERAKELGAYQRRENTLYNESWVSQRRRIADLEQKVKGSQAKRGGRTSEQEIAYRELKARGYDPDDPLFQYRDSPYYDILKRASQIDAIDLDRQPGGKAMQRYVELIRAQGGRLNMEEMLAQATKLTGSPNAARELVAVIVADTNRKIAAEAPPKDETPAQKQAREELAKAKQKLLVEEEKAKTLLSSAQQGLKPIEKQFDLQRQAAERAELERVKREQKLEKATAQPSVFREARIRRGERKLGEAAAAEQAAGETLLDTQKLMQEQRREIKTRQAQLALAEEAVAAGPKPVNPRIAQLEARRASLREQLAELEDGPEFDALVGVLDRVEAELATLRGGAQ